MRYGWLDLLDLREKVRMALMKNSAKRLLMIVMVIVVMLMLFFIRSDRRLIYYEVIAAEIVDGFISEAVFIRDEWLQLSPFEGRIVFLKNEGAKVRSSTPVAQILTAEGSQEIYAFTSGVISFHYDHFENYFTLPLNLMLYRNLYAELPTVTHQIEEGQHIAPGEVLFRMVNNYNFYCVFKYPQDELLIAEGRKIEVVFPDLSAKTYSAQVISFDRQSNLMLLRFDFFYNDFLTERQQEIEIIKARYQGAVIPLTAIDNVNGISGVWVFNRGENTFRPIEVIGDNGEQAVIKGVAIGDQILLNP